jgi:glycosyltransferase involved in cell wall biosynthesis
MALYESQAVGTPVIGTTAGGAVEAMKDGVTGIAVPPNDADALAHALDKMLEDADFRKRLADNCRAFAESRNMESSVDSLLSVFELAKRR